MTEATTEDLMQAATDLRNELALAEPRVDEATVVKIIARTLMAERTRQEERVRVLEEALTCAVNVWAPLEPGDSRAVSDEFVAVAAVSSGHDNPQCHEIIRAANARAGLGNGDSK
jgi:hypothetical protein